MANSKQSTGNKSEKPFNFYGIRTTSNPNYFSVTLVRGGENRREWLNIPINAKKVKVYDEYAVIKLSKLEENEKSKDKAEGGSEDMPF